MHPAAKLQFERIVIEYARWRGLPAADRPPAPAWWWGSAVEVREISAALPTRCSALALRTTMPTSPSDTTPSTPAAARPTPCSPAVSYTHLTLPTNREV